MEKIKVLIVDDSSAFVKLMEKLLQNDEQFEVVGIAYNGKEAIKQVKALQPDVVTLDVEMPEMNGIEVVEYLMKNHPLPILMLSSLTYAGSKAAIASLMAGAVDFLLKPINPEDFEIIKFKLLFKLKLVAKAKILPFSSSKKIEDSKSIKDKIHEKIEDQKVIKKVIAIGVSTGGPPTLRQLFAQIPSNFNVPIIVAQHMPEKYTSLLAERLKDSTSLKIKEVEDNEELKETGIFIAQGGKDCILDNQKRFKIIDNKEQIALPCIDNLFFSLSQIFKENTIGIILTGMGNDGLMGAREIKKNGGKIIAQDESSSVIYGMPKIIADEHIADTVVSLDKMGETILRYL